MRGRLFDLAAAFGLGYFFGLGALALTHVLSGWPASYEQASVLALLSGAGGLLTRLYNARVVRPPDRD
jgi:hypothetical protein